MFKLLTILFLTSSALVANASTWSRTTDRSFADLQADSNYRLVWPKIYGSDIRNFCSTKTAFINTKPMLLCTEMNVSREICSVDTSAFCRKYKPGDTVWNNEKIVEHRTCAKSNFVINAKFSKARTAKQCVEWDNYSELVRTETPEPFTCIRYKTVKVKMPSQFKVAVYSVLNDMAELNIPIGYKTYKVPACR